MSVELGLFDQPQSDFNGPPKARETNRLTAERWVQRWHYLGSMSSASACYGFFRGDLAAVVIVGNGANASGLAARVHLKRWPGNYEITRVVCHPDAPKNTASQAIAAVGRLLRARGLTWVFSYADTGQAHHGGIYQALNCVYLGVTSTRNGYLADGKMMHPRQVVEVFGTEAWPRAQQIAADRDILLEKVPDALKPKHIYVYPVGSPAVNRAIRKALAPHSLPYPRRMQAAS